MKAWQVDEHGEPRDVLRVDEVPQPRPGAGQVLVRVRAAALNFPDVLMARGQYQVRPPLPFVPGVELCGEVVEVGGPAQAGSSGSGWRIGQRIIGTPAPGHGAFAEFTVLDEADVFAAPDALDDAEAAALHIGYQTGWFGLHRRAQLRAGETLLVHAAAGGVGSAAVQLGKAAGARVVGVVGGAAKAQVAVKLGADVVVDRATTDFVSVVKEVTGGRGADVVYDPVGGEAFERSAKCIAFEGRLLVVGFASGRIPQIGANHPLVKNYSVVGLHWGLYRQHAPHLINEAHERLTALAAAGTVAPLVSARLNFADLPEGLTRLAGGDTVGRLVLLVP